MKEPDSRVEAKSEQAAAVLIKQMQKDKSYPISIIYMHEHIGLGYMRIKWSQEEKTETTIPAENLYFTSEQAKQWNYIIKPDPALIDKSRFVPSSASHVIVFDETGRFGGWHANNGIWSQGNEIVVGFVLGYYQVSVLHHSIDKDKPQVALLARSLDGGET